MPWLYRPICAAVCKNKTAWSGLDESRVMVRVSMKLEAGGGIGLAGLSEG